MVEWGSQTRSVCLHQQVLKTLSTEKLKLTRLWTNNENLCQPILSLSEIQGFFCALVVYLAFRTGRFVGHPRNKLAKHVLMWWGDWWATNKRELPILALFTEHSYMPKIQQW
jgi:hypothetical protein